VLKWGEMPLIRSSAEELLAEAKAGRLQRALAKAAELDDEFTPGEAKAAEWGTALPELLTDLVDADLGHLDVIVEPRLGKSPKHVDLVLCGQNPHTQEPSYMLVKMASPTAAVPETDELIRFDDALQLHPAAQVRQYCEYLLTSAPKLAENPRSIHGFAYVHGPETEPWLDRYDHSDLVAAFTPDRRTDLQYHLRSLFKADDDRARARQVGDEFLGLHHNASFLIDTRTNTINQSLVLLDEQEVAYQEVLRAVERARAAGTPTAVVVLGGPGSGKSAIALKLKRTMESRGYSVEHATGSRSFTNTLRKVGATRSNKKYSGFRYFNDYITATPRELDALLCDEAHRIRETSVSRFTSKAVREHAGRQVDELIKAAKVPVFLLDERQTVRPGEMGSRREIEAAAAANGYHCEVLRLDSQFRCGGSARFDAWVARLLGINNLGPVPWSKIATLKDESLTLATASGPEELESWLLRQRNEHGGTARLSAGFCWTWSKDPIKSGDKVVLKDDVVIGDWKRPWNARPEKQVPGVPASHFWATDERGFGQVGCVYTAQGFEYDWSGVILGLDFVRRGDDWVANPDESHDDAVTKARNDPQYFRTLIAHTYKVLLTRGMRGTCIYSTDPETQQFLETMTA